MGNYTIFGGFENPRRGRQARNLTTNVPKILDLKSSSAQIFSKNCRWVPLTKISRNYSARKGNPVRYLSFVVFECFLMLRSLGNEKNLTDAKLPHQIKIQSIDNNRFFFRQYRKIPKISPSMYKPLQI